MTFHSFSVIIEWIPKSLRQKGGGKEEIKSHQPKIDL